MTKPKRPSHALRDRKRKPAGTIVRKSRAGRDSHPSGNRVRHATPEEPVPLRTPRPITLPELTCLKRIKIAGEWI